jgi:signal transduction histidine kinase
VTQRLRRAFSRLAGDRLRPAPTLRLRLTVLYASLFSAGGAAVLAIMYLLVERQAAVYLTRTAPSALGHGGPLGTAPTVMTSRIVVAITAMARHERTSLLVDSAVALAFMAGISAVVGWVVAGRVLRPMADMTATLRQITADRLGRRLAATGPADEVRNLADTVDGLLERLERAFDAQRRFVAHASHELRTPLTLQRALAEVSLAEDGNDPAALRRTVERMLAAGQRQERVIEALLTLARSERGLDVRYLVDLAAVADAAMLQIEGQPGLPAAPFERRLEPATVLGDEQLLERLVMNLLDNALRYGGGLPVAVTVRGGPAGAVLEVRNGGPAVPADQVARLLEPFERLDRGRADHTGGLGLGLSIVNAIARAHDAVLELRPGERGGLEVRVRFPPVEAVRRT